MDPDQPLSSRLLLDGDKNDIDFDLDRIKSIIDIYVKMHVDIEIDNLSGYDASF